MKYTRKHELLLYVLGVGGFLGLLFAGSLYAAGAVWLRVAALAWFLGLGLVRCLALLTLGRGGADEAATLPAGAKRQAR